MRWSRIRRSDGRSATLDPRVKREGTNNGGFARPTAVSDDLADFLSKECGLSIEHGGEISRNDVTRTLCAYFKDKKLPDTKDGRIIHPNKKLSKLLNYEETDKNGEPNSKKLTYFYLQTLLAPHYVKRDAKEDSD